VNWLKGFAKTFDFRDLIERYSAEHLPHLSPTNASDQKSMLHKLVEPDWGNRLVAEIIPSDVEKLLTKIAAGRSRPSKTKWNGVTHVVDVTGDGFVWKRQSYRSLSAIAREFTGAHWSGPRFFGLNGKAKR
jgi:Protein of unknown function (DUF2924)